MSRDAFSHDPQDALDPRNTSRRGSAHSRRSASPTRETAGIASRRPWPRG